MDDVADVAGLAVGALAIWVALSAFSVGLLWFLYFRDRSYRNRHHMPHGFVALTFAVAGTITFAASTWASFLTIRTILGLERLEWTPAVTVPLLLFALSMPIGFAVVLLYQRLRY